MNIQKLKEEQLKLAEKVIIIDSFDKIKYIGGCDQSYSGNKIISCVVVMDEKMKIVDKAFAEKECNFPYIPGFLSYRESPAVVEAFNKLKIKPDILMVDGNGILHPRRFGMASHLGIILDIPTIGITKSLLIGKVIDGKIEVDKEIRGMEVKTREFSNPLYVSPGHRISLKTAVEIVKKSIIFPHKLPEPLHLAHRLAKKRKENSEQKNTAPIASASISS
ncbi:MAG: endonuclease V [Candidatus Woesearchaeota archaeon]|nr:endonuclease V [Candidatus Woesearchaeota archaeon]